jgi:cobalt-zinc-cadmium efflux system protein
VFVAIEFIYGVIAGSTALVADASHNLGDVLGLLLAWGAAWLHQRRPSKTMTYGFRKSTVVASLANALLIVLTVGAVMWESVGRFANPQPVSSSIMIWVAAIGVAINAGSAVLFMRGAKSDLNLRGAYLHLIADASVSVAVVVAGLIIMLKPDWLWVDPVTSIAVSLLVLWSTWQLLRQSLLLTLDGVPGHLDTESVKQTLLAIPGVVDVADLHVWALSTSEAALTAHLVVAEGAPQTLANVAGAKVRDLYGIGHSTIQIDAVGQACAHC